MGVPEVRCEVQIPAPKHSTTSIFYASYDHAPTLEQLGRGLHVPGDGACYWHSVAAHYVGFEQWNEAVSHDFKACMMRMIRTHQDLVTKALNASVSAIKHTDRLAGMDSMGRWQSGHSHHASLSTPLAHCQWHGQQSGAL